MKFHSKQILCGKENLEIQKYCSELLSNNSTIRFTLTGIFFSEGAERMYYFTRLAIELNEPEDGVAPTDSRLRPDQRLMEEGKWDEANEMKLKIEEKQRAVRRQREALAEKALQRGYCLLGHLFTF